VAGDDIAGQGVANLGEEVGDPLTVLLLGAPGFGLLVHGIIIHHSMILR
jgi:hypothetical protein